MTLVHHVNPLDALNESEFKKSYIDQVSKRHTLEPVVEEEIIDLALVEEPVIKQSVIDKEIHDKEEAERVANERKRLFAVQQTLAPKAKKKKLM